MSKSEGDNRENNKALNEKMSRPFQLLKLKVFMKYMTVLLMQLCEDIKRVFLTDELLNYQNY